MGSVTTPLDHPGAVESDDDPPAALTEPDRTIAAYTGRPLPEDA